jgi:PIN domain nuclease of toxin-antitoxin system
VAAARPGAPTSVLDTSALLAFAQDEDGAAVVDAALEGRSAISVVNWAETLSKVAERGGDPAALEAEYREKGFIGTALTIEPLTEADCIEVGKLRPVTKPQGLSLADRSCLVLAARLGVPALTSDGAFADAKVEAEVVLIR